MIQLLYISTARDRPGAEQLCDILAVSRRNNRRDSLTGLLVSGGRRFLQVLEGERNAVEAAFARIKADPRHFAVVVLGRKEIAERAFPHWEMGFEAAAQPAEGEDLAAIVADLAGSVADPSLRAQLLGFAEFHSAA